MMVTMGLTQELINSLTRLDLTAEVDALLRYHLKKTYHSLELGKNQLATLALRMFIYSIDNLGSRFIDPDVADDLTTLAQKAVDSIII